MKTDAGMKKKDLEEVLKQAKQQIPPTSKLTWGDAPAIRPINEEMYKFLEGFVRDGGAAFTGSAEGSRAPKIEAFSGASVWFLDLGSPNRNFVSVDITDGDSKSVLDKPITSGADPRLEFVTLGKYRLKPNITGKPKQYVLKYREGSKEESVTRPWPVSNEGFWLIELTNFDGKPAELFTLLEEGDFAIPIKQVIGKESTTLVLTDLTTGELQIESGFSANTFNFRFPLVRNKNRISVEKMYVLFPMTKSDAAKMVKELDQKSGEDLMKYIDSKKPSASGDQTVLLKPSMAPSWFEVPQSIGMYERAIPIDDIQGWKDQARNANAETDRSWRVNVYKLARKDASLPSTAAKVNHPVSKELVYAVDMEEMAWLPGLKTLQPEPKKVP